ncbi:MAG: SUMF1/EgtB/PvdO family nonheme iron enzyme [Verrucomicrobiaceae bacterium]|nr:SUMF1/EgtB/PvdO family nonheme iron enzyme [Verrucomicrobiaceae bacterium]
MCPATAAPVLSNITAAQRTGTKLVDISYDVSSTSVSQVKISLQVSNDGGVSFAVPVTTTSGDIGTGISTGTNKTITWNAGLDWNQQSSSQMRFRLTAEELVIPGFSLIPGSSFDMGDAVDGDTNAPVHAVTVSTCYMQTTEVPRSLWNSVRAAAGAYGYNDLATGDSKSGGTLDHPVYSVSWYDVVKWCNARSEEEGLTPCYYTNSSQTTIYRTGSLNLASDSVKWDANGYRLPTEAEWEKAARGGVAGKRYPWGTNTISYAQANFYSTYANGSFGDQSGGAGYNPTYAVGGERYTAPVGDFAPNGFGLHQVAGNVWEWCWDSYNASYYTSSPSTDPQGPSPVINRVQRGAGLDRPEWCKVSNRGAWRADTPNINVGFRSLRGGSVVRNSASQQISATVTVNTNGPVITSHPQSQSVYETYPITFSVTATGTGTLHYQWRRAGTNIPTATSNTYTLSSASFTDMVNFDVLVTDDSGTTQSNAAALTVISRAPTATVTPASPVVNPNVAVTFNANVVTGIAPFTYQWRKNGAKITGATASTYTIASAQQSHEGSYTCLVTNTFGSMAPTAAALTVNDPVTFVVPPLTQAANVGDEVTLHVQVTGTGPFTYQWRRNTTPLSGETGQDLTFTTDASSGGVYDVVVTNVVGSATSLPATLTMLTPPVITADPVDQALAAGATANFSVTATGVGLSYQWRRNGVALTGKTSATLALPNVQVANTGTYDVVVKNSFGTVISAPVTLSLTSALAITTQPTDSTNNVGTTATFTVAASSPGVLTYQWAKDGVAIPTAKTAALSVPVTSASVAGAYTVTVTSGALKVTSLPAMLRVNDAGLLIYKLTATGSTYRGVTTTQKAITATMIVDRTNQSGGMIWFGKNGVINTFRTELSPNLHTHSTGPVSKSQTVVDRIAFQGSDPHVSWALMWLRGADSLLTISTTDKTMGPLTLSGVLNLLDLNSDVLIEGFTLTATLDAVSSAQARQAGETVERALNRLAASWQLKGYVRE